MTSQTLTCLCGVKISIVSDLFALNEAIHNHLTEHEKLTGKRLSEDALIADVLRVVIEKINKNLTSNSIHVHCVVD